MAAPGRDLLGGWRAWRAAEALAAGPGGGAVALLGAAEAAAEALAAGPGEGAHDAAERRALAAHYAEAPAPAPYRPGDPDPLRDGLLAGALARPPAWADVAAPPPPGAWCSCCGRHHRRGGRWWREAAAPTGWRCATCHPPVHMAPGAVVVVRT